MCRWAENVSIAAPHPRRAPTVGAAALRRARAVGGPPVAATTHLEEDRVGRRSRVELYTEALKKAVQSGCDLSRVSVVRPHWWSPADLLGPTVKEEAVNMKESRVKEAVEHEESDDEHRADGREDFVYWVPRAAESTVQVELAAEEPKRCHLTWKSAECQIDKFQHHEQ